MIICLGVRVTLIQDLMRIFAATLIQIIFHRLGASPLTLPFAWRHATCRFANNFRMKVTMASWVAFSRCREK